MGTTPRDITGQAFGRLTALRRDGLIGTHTAWLFRCECGAEKRINMGSVTRGATRSCGCLHMDRCKTGLNRLSHGAAKKGEVTRLHNIWRDIIKRCKGADPRYGGRGIVVCPEWAADFVAFQDWASANGYADDLTIDRIDNDGPYAPTNCRWVGRQEQARNRRSSRHITVNGRTQVLAAWLAETGLARGSFYHRLRLGWTEQEALFPTR